MNKETLALDEIPMPALLRHARVTYGFAMHRALGEAGFEDIPKNGLYVIGMLASGSEDVSVGQLVKELTVSKQAAGQLVDTLVLRGYVDRMPDEADRRKLIVTLTERGRAAAAIQAEARKKIDVELTERVGKENVTCTRRTLAELINMRCQENDKQNDEP